MSNYAVDSTLNVEQWASKEMYAFVRSNPFTRYMGTTAESPIQVLEDLESKSGDAITFQLVGELTGSGVADDATLEGNEEALGNYGHKVTVNQLRNGVVRGKHEQQKTNIQILKAARIALRMWNVAQARNLILARALSPVVDGLTTYAAASEAQKDAWCAANNPATTNERILFGAASSNSSGDHSADLAKVDAAADELHQEIVRLIRRKAQGCDPAIRPASMTNKDGLGGSERFVMFVGSIPFRDLVGNFETILSNADSRGDDNHLFASGDLRVGNVIVHEVPEMDRLNTAHGTTISGVGDTAINVQATFLMGAQALLWAWASRMKFKTRTDDYDNLQGVAVAETRGCEKATFNSVQHGMATAYVAAVAD